MKVRQGERFVVTEDHSVQGLTHWLAPFTGGFEGTIPAGTIVVARYDQHPTAPAFNAIPEDYEGLEEMLIPSAERSHGKYDGYSLTLFASDIGDWLLLLDDD